jgi:uncharacterized DUF497 family protein
VTFYNCTSESVPRFQGDIEDTDTVTQNTDKLIEESDTKDYPESKIQKIESLSTTRHMVVVNGEL